VPRRDVCVELDDIYNDEASFELDAAEMLKTEINNTHWNYQQQLVQEMIRLESELERQKLWHFEEQVLSRKE
jgi:uncharacterized protein RhaS with RHS repeats